MCCSSSTMCTLLTTSSFKMSASMLGFHDQRRIFTEKIRLLQSDEDITDTDLNQIFLLVTGNDNDKKCALDQAFRDILKEQIVSSGACSDYTRLIKCAMNAVSLDLCSHSIPFLMLSDVFDTATLEKCDDVFSFVEEHVSTWKSETFYNAGKNYLLRMSNDLLRRLSKSQNTVFCGRIQLFLARLFPLDEKSGLNLMSNFNYDNLTVFSSSDDKFRRPSTEDKLDESMEEGEMLDLSTSSILVDYNLYRRFWSLQDYFRKPNQCYEKVSWKIFVQNSDEVLKAFKSYKLDDMSSSQRKLEKLRQSEEAHAYFAKYLTSEKLLDLQLSDSNFRRYVLVQFLILFQYLYATVKFKSSSYTITEDQSGWIKNTSESIYKLIQETPPNGKEFASIIEHILSCEENWNQWKNDGCPSYVREKVASTCKPQLARGRKRSMEADIKACGSKLIKMGSAELTRLWNLCPDNMEACKTEKRIFLPTLDKFFEEAIEQADPEQMVEDEYKLVNETNYQWRALRLLARRSPHFFAQTSQPAKKLNNYLEAMVKKVSKDFPPPGGESKNTEQEDEDNEKENNEEELQINKQEENDKDEVNEATPENQEPLVSAEQVVSLSRKLTTDWKKLAIELNMKEDEISYFESEADDATQQASNMLTVWKENEGEKATENVLRAALKEIGLVELAATIFGEQNGA